MSVPENTSRHNVALYIEHAHEMLKVAACNLADGFYGSAVRGWL
jgi:hypothetical protein